MFVGSVRVHFLGSGDAFAGGGRFQACLHLDGGPQPLLLDCGATALIAMKRARIDPASIGYVALSHLHGDHFSGLPWVILDGQFSTRSRPLVIAGPESVRERVERTFESLYPGATNAQRTFDTSFVEFSEQAPCQLGPALITPFEVKHGSGAPAYALRVEYASKVIAYSGDTEWTDRLVEAASDADLFICECNFFDRNVPGHLSYRTLTDKRPRLACERIVITHMGEEMLARLDDVDLEAAADGAVITI